MAVIKIVPMPGAVGDKGDEGATGAQGPQGETGLQGPAGEDALWHYNGSWQSNATYAEGDVVTYEGQTYYATGITTLATTPDIDSNFDLIAAKGEPGEPGLNGIEGETGATGPQGEQGPQGEPGTPGTELNFWNFVGDPGVPTVDGALVVDGISGRSGGNAVVFAESGGSVILAGTSGEFLNDSNFPSNQIATIGDIETSVNDALPDEESFVVNGGTLDVQPTFTGAPLFTGSYVKHGPMVFFQVQVDMDNITSFGTGQYFIDLPFTAKYGQQFKEGCLHDISSGKQYAIGGHVYAGESRMSLTFTNSAGQDDPFDYNSPVVLSTADNFHISGTFISA